MNTPYVKQYNNKGEVTNPIKGTYISEHPNRRSRRSAMKGERFRGNTSEAMLVYVTKKFRKVWQVIKDDAGEEVKRIMHYLSSYTTKRANK